MSTYKISYEHFSLAAIRAIPAGTTTLDLSNPDVGDIDLSDVSGPTLALAFAAIPPSVTTLILAHNRLADSSGADLAVAFAAIPEWVKVLDLSVNGLCNFNMGELPQVFVAIPRGIRTLNLSDNHFGGQFLTYRHLEFASSLAAIPQWVETLNLSDNYLLQFNIENLTAVLAAIPRGIKTLVLSNNNFNSKSRAELAAVFAALPTTIRKLICKELSKDLKDCVLYRNFKTNEFVEHDDLDIKQIQKRALGFCSTVAGGIAKDPLMLIFSKYLTSYDLANLHMVCKNKAEPTPITKKYTYCGFRPGFLL